MQVDIDQLIRRSELLQRYAVGYSNDLSSISKKGNRKLITIIREFLDNATEKDKTDLIRRNTRNPRIKELLDGIDAAVLAQSKAVTAKAEKETLALAASEIAKTSSAFKATAIALPTAATVVKTPVLGTLIKDSYSFRFAQHLINIKIGLVGAIQNDQDPIAVIKGTSDQNFKNGIFFKLERDIRTTAETQVHGVANNAKAEVYDSYKVEREVIVETLDFKTCSICGGYDGEVYPVGEGARPPFHPRCRGVTIPYYGEDEWRPYVNARSVGDLTKAQRVKGIGRTKMNYEKWFEKQPVSHQKNVLGQTKYKAYKAGDLTLDDMTNRRTGKPYTLKELDLVE